MNVICILSDSLRRDHLGCYGNDWIRTPNLNAFAKDATVFEEAYQGSHPTLPNRTDHFTGKYSFPWHGWRPLAADEFVLAEAVGQKDIVSMLIGDTYHMFKENFYFYRGFTGWWWNRGQEGDRLITDATIPIVYPCAKGKIRLPYPERYEQIIRNRYYRRVETDWFAPGTFKKAVEWLEHNYQHDSFLLWIDIFDPHEPWDPPQYYIDMYDPDYDLDEDCDYPEGAPCTFLSEPELKHTRARYAGEVTMVDRWFGFFMEKVDELGLLKDTLILFTADHGHYLNYPGDGGLIGKPLGYKGERFPMYQSLVNIPLIVRMPDGVGAGERRKGIIQPADTMPTILDFLGIDIPKHCHGQSFLPLLLGEPQQHRKFAFSGAYKNVAQVSNAQWSYVCWEGHRPSVLFDLTNDPLQTQNIIEQNEDVATMLYGELIKFLQSIAVPEEKVERYQRFESLYL